MQFAMLSNLDHSQVPTIVTRFRQVCATNPSAPALEFAGTVVDYSTLDALSDNLASYLHEVLGVKPTDCVGICLDSTPNLVIALLAILKTGAAYVPLDPALPTQRLGYMFRDAALQVVITQCKYSLDVALGAPLAVSPRLLLIDQDYSWPLRRPAKDPAPASLGPSDLASVIYTSGSTGEPKGVMIEHGGLLNLALCNVKLLGIHSGTRLIQFAALGFDAASWEIFTTLAGGGTLVLGTRDDLISGRALAAFLAHKRVTMICIPPSLLTTLHDARNDLQHLDTVVVAGEACPLPMVRIWATARRRLFNAYGPTEATVCATMHQFSGTEDTVPIGVPLPGVTVFLADEQLQPVAPGTPGEHMQLASLPMMPNRSKVDRSALPLPATRPAPRHLASERAQQIALLFDQALELPLGTFRAHSHFFEMGGTSMGVAHVVMALKTEFGVRVPSRQVYEYPTPTSMATLIDSSLRSPYRTAAAEIVNLRAEAVLDPDITPQICAGVRGVPEPPKVVLLTGATGFLGSHLLRALLVRDPLLTVHCLMRGRSREPLKERLRRVFMKYQLSTADFDRVRVVAGDIEESALGLYSAEYARFAAAIDTVYHCAADINYIKPYAAMRGPNVVGTSNLLRFACAGRAKAFHYASSVAVFGATATLLGIDEVGEDFDIDRSCCIMNSESGYTKSKWVAERLVRDASGRGLRVAIYRLGFIEGATGSGIANVTDLLCRLLCGCIQLGHYPSFNDKYWLPSPVDFVAGAMAHISLSGREGVYHLTPERQHETGHNEMFRIIDSLGFPVQPLSPDAWFERLATCSAENALYPMVAFLLERIHEGRNTILEVHHKTSLCHNTGSQAALAGAGVPRPSFDRALLKTYLDYFVSCRLIEPPNAHRSHSLAQQT